MLYVTVDFNCWLKVVFKDELARILSITINFSILMFMHYIFIEVWELSFYSCNTLCFIINFCLWIFHVIIFLWTNLKVKFFFTKISITNIFLFFCKILKIKLILQFSCPLMIKVTMKILFSVLMTSFFLSKYKCCMNESFLLLINYKFNFIFLIHYIFLFFHFICMFCIKLQYHEHG